MVLNGYAVVSGNGLAVAPLGVVTQLDREGEGVRGLAAVSDGGHLLGDVGRDVELGIVSKEAREELTGGE